MAHILPPLLALLLLASALVVGVWDTFAIYSQQSEHTVSELLRRWSVAHPILPFVAGVLVGHVFW